LTEREGFVLRFPVDAVELDEHLGCVTVRLTDEQLLAWLPAVQAGLEGLEPVDLPVTGTG
jgi:hypothetical protein